MAYTTINKSTDYFNTKLYSGNGGTQSITGVGFQPDWTWFKQRDNGSYSHMAFDAVRGVTKRIEPDTNATEGNQTNGLTAFGTDGFSIGDFSAGNYSGRNYVAWNWKAGTAVSGNTGGSGTAKTYTGSVNTTSGFSIIKYTGNGTLGHTIPHHLGVAPSMMIIKITAGDTSDWYVYHKSLGNTGIMFLSNTNAVSNSNAYWNSTTPTSSVFTVGDQTGNNSNNNTFIAYCFAEKQGYSKFGSYKGNGNTDGSFIYTGFKPAFIMVKRTDSTGDWQLMDNKRDPINVMDTNLFPNSNDADTPSSTYNTDFVSNGFKFRGTSGARNGSGMSYIYMAFAEAPLVGTNNVPCTAR